MNIWLAVFSVAVVAILYTVLVSICISNSIFVSYNINNSINSNAYLIQKRIDLLKQLFQVFYIGWIRWTYQHTCTYWFIVDRILIVIRLKVYKLDFVKCWIYYTRLACNDILYAHTHTHIYNEPITLGLLLMIYYTCTYKHFSLSVSDKHSRRWIFFAFVSDYKII